MLNKHTASSISAKIFQNNPGLTEGKKDDILALLEEFEKRYGRDFFSEKLNLVNAMRITGLKYITARNVLMELTHESVNDILALHPLLELQEVVFKKIDTLHTTKDSIPNYPNHNLNMFMEWAQIQKVADLSFINQIQILRGRPVSEILVINPRLFYFFF